jgi:hypothetical protein
VESGAALEDVARLENRLGERGDPPKAHLLPAPTANSCKQIEAVYAACPWVLRAERSASMVRARAPLLRHQPVTGRTAPRGASAERVEVHGVEVELDAQRGEGHALARAPWREQPRRAGTTREHLDAPTRLRHEDVVLQRLEPLVVRELLAAVARLGAGREDLDDDDRVDDGRLVVGVGLHGATDDEGVGVGRAVRLVDPDPDVRSEDDTGATIEGVPKESNDVGGETAMFRRATSHRPHVSAKVFVLLVRALLELDELLPAELLRGGC